jgi:hypothetical protein
MVPTKNESDASFLPKKIAFSNWAIPFGFPGKVFAKTVVPDGTNLPA